jgi:hypothetical protein
MDMTEKHMTVAQLIADLQDFPQDWPVLIPGHENGSTSVVGAFTTRVVLDEKQPWYYGEWRDAGPNVEGSVEAVYIGGRRHG